MDAGIACWTASYLDEPVTATGHRLSDTRQMKSMLVWMKICLTWDKLEGSYFWLHQARWGMSAGAALMLALYAIRYGDKSGTMTLLHNVWVTQSLYDSLSDGRRPICSKCCLLQKRMSYIIYAYATQACVLCVCARMHKCIPLPMQVKLLAG